MRRVGTTLRSRRSSRGGKCGGRAGKQRALTWGEPKEEMPWEVSRYLSQSVNLQSTFFVLAGFVVWLCISDASEQVRATLLQRLDVCDLVVRRSLLPAAEHDPDPLERNDTDCGVAALPLGAKVLVKRLGPDGVADGDVGVLVECLEGNSVPSNIICSASTSYGLIIISPRLRRPRPRDVVRPFARRVLAMNVSSPITPLADLSAASSCRALSSSSKNSAYMRRCLRCFADRSSQIGC